jgi:TolA-binding protein
MKKLIGIIAVSSILFLTGCGNLSPRDNLSPQQQQRIDNQNGRIQEMENLANSMRLEVGKLQSQAEIQNSKLEKIQQGLANFQSNNENSGVQILSGSGGLIIAVLALFCGTVVALTYRKEAKKQEKVANILAERIVSQSDPLLEDQVFQAAMYTDVEGDVLHIMQKHQTRLAAVALQASAR